MAAAFRTCGLSPVDKQEVLKNLPRKNREDGNASRQLLDETFAERLEQLRGASQPARKKRGKKVPPGRSYTALPSSSEEEEESEGEDVERLLEEDGDRLLEESEVDSEEEEEIIRPASKRSRCIPDDEDEDEAEPRPSSSRAEPRPSSSRAKPRPSSGGASSSPAEDFPVGAFVVAMYEGTWYVGQVEGEDPDEEAEGFTLIQYMERKGDNRFVWSKKDLLKTLNTDILLQTEPPIPVSTRGFFGLPSDTLRNVEKLVKEWSILILRIKNFKPFFLSIFDLFQPFFRKLLTFL